MKSFFGEDRLLLRDSSAIYNKALSQARNPEFYGENRVSDDYDGRIDLLTLHISVILFCLRRHEEQGKRLSQAIYDRMKDDFEVALREEGIADTGVKRRIKAMIRLFYDRLKKYSASFESETVVKDLKTELSASLLKERPDSVVQVFADYTEQFLNDTAKLTLGEIAQAQFEFPQIQMDK